jgi:hypothetical protein
MIQRTDNHGKPSLASVIFFAANMFVDRRYYGAFVLFNACVRERHLLFLGIEQGYLERISLA